MDDIRAAIAYSFNGDYLKRNPNILDLYIVSLVLGLLTVLHPVNEISSGI